MKKLLTIFLAMALAGAAMAQDDEPDRMIDTVVFHGDVPFRVQRVETQLFDSLRAIYYKKPPRPETNIRRIEKVLGPPFKLTYQTIDYEGDFAPDCILSQVRKGNEYRLLINESDGLQGFYPQERIMLYYGGHSSDQAFFVDTGLQAWNPQYACFSADGRWRMTGLHTGQEQVDYRLEWRENPGGEFRFLGLLQEITEHVPLKDIGYTYFVFDPFWVGGTLYFQTGGNGWGDEIRFVALTPFRKTIANNPSDEENSLDRRGPVAGRLRQ